MAKKQEWAKGFLESLDEDKKEVMIERAPSIFLQMAYLGNAEMIAGLLKKKNDRQMDLFDEESPLQDKFGNGLLHYAAEGGQGDLAKKIAKASPDELSRANSAGRVPLHMAALSGDKETVAALLAAGAPLDAADADGSTPLHLAAWVGSKGVLEAMVKKGADLNAQDKEGMSALMMAVLSGSEPATKFLAEAGADLEAIDARKRSAMHYASQTGQNAMADILEKAGSIFFDKDASGKTPDDYRSDFEQGLKTVEALAKHGAEKRKKRIS